MKDGQTHLAHKAEHAVDLRTGSIVAVRSVVHLRCLFFDAVGRVPNQKVEAKQFVQTVVNVYLWQP